MTLLTYWWSISVGFIALFALGGCGSDAMRPGSPAGERGARITGEGGLPMTGAGTTGDTNGGPVEPPTQGGEPPTSRGGLLTLDFSDSALGEYTTERVQAEWPGTRWASPEGRVTIEEENENRFMRVRYPTGGVGPQAGGAQWWVNLDGLLGRTFDELYLSYRVRFREGFDFVRGGKLPGLLGGAGNTGSGIPTGRDGWSGRMMWRTGGSVVQYVYHPDQRGNYPQDLSWGRKFTTGDWITVEHRIVMNTPGSRDGVVQGWYNGELALDRTNMRYRDVATFGVDGIYFSTFFGGADGSWAPTRDEYIDFDDFVFSEEPITH